SIPSMVILLYAPWLFMNQSSSSRYLTWAFFLALVVEAFHGLLPGSILCGVGMGLLFMDFSRQFFDWGEPIVKLTGVTFFVVVIIIVRMIYHYLLYGALISPLFFGWGITLITGLILIEVEDRMDRESRQEHYL
ncbi:MAG: hypothetical protein ABEJ65_03255, partial [bacterium]